MRDIDFFGYSSDVDGDVLSVRLGDVKILGCLLPKIFPHQLVGEGFPIRPGSGWTDRPVEKNGRINQCEYKANTFSAFSHEYQEVDLNCSVGPARGTVKVTPDG
jgi:hypothetical protein